MVMDTIWHIYRNLALAKGSKALPRRSRGHFGDIIFHHIDPSADHCDILLFGSYLLDCSRLCWVEAASLCNIRQTYFDCTLFLRFEGNLAIFPLLVWVDTTIASTEV